MAWPIFGQSCSASRPVRTVATSTAPRRTSMRLRELEVAHLEREEQHRLAPRRATCEAHAESERGVVHEARRRRRSCAIGDGEVVHLLLADELDGDDLVPQHVRLRPAPDVGEQPGGADDAVLARRARPLPSRGLRIRSQTSTGSVSATVARESAAPGPRPRRSRSSCPRMPISRCSTGAPSSVSEIVEPERARTRPSRGCTGR